MSQCLCNFLPSRTLPSKIKSKTFFLPTCIVKYWFQWIKTLIHICLKLHNLCHSIEWHISIQRHTKNAFFACCVNPRKKKLSTFSPLKTRVSCCWSIVLHCTKLPFEIFLSSYVLKLNYVLDRIHHGFASFCRLEYAIKI